MPPKQFPGKSRAIAEPGFAQSALQVVKSPENRSVIMAVGLFAIGVTFLHSSWAEILLPA